MGEAFLCRTEAAQGKPFCVLLRQHRVRVPETNPGRRGEAFLCRNESAQGKPFCVLTGSVREAFLCGREAAQGEGALRLLCPLILTFTYPLSLARAQLQYGHPPPRAATHKWPGLKAVGGPHLPLAAPSQHHQHRGSALAGVRFGPLPVQTGPCPCAK